MRTFMHRTEGEPTNCHDCGEAPIMGCNYHDPDHKLDRLGRVVVELHRVLCLDCASNTGATFQKAKNSAATTNGCAPIATGSWMSLAQAQCSKPTNVNANVNGPRTATET